MQYLQEVIDLATHYPYPYNVCYYVYMAHGNKAEDILKVGAEYILDGFFVMKLSDLCLRDWVSYPPNDDGATDPIRRNLRHFVLNFSFLR